MHEMMVYEAEQDFQAATVASMNTWRVLLEDLLVAMLVLLEDMLVVMHALRTRGCPTLRLRRRQSQSGSLGAVGNAVPGSG